MTAAKTLDAPLPSQEALLADYSAWLARHREGRRAVHIHLSRLQPHNRREHHLRIAADTFESLVRKFDGRLFNLANSDIVFVGKGASAGDLDSAVLKIRFLFHDDPLTRQADEQIELFYTSFDIEKDHAPFGARVRQIVHDAEQRRRGVETLAEPRRPHLARLDAKELDRIERSVEQADLSNVMRRQPIAAIVGEHPPELIFHELFISIEDLQQVLAPRVDLLSDRWLFQHLTQSLDRRMLALVPRIDDATIANHFSLNLNLSTLLSEEFLAFDAALKSNMRGTIVIEVQLIDALADLGAFHFARDFVRERGYRVCLDGLTHHAAAVIDRERLGVDFVKVIWSPDLHDRTEGEQHDLVKAAIARMGTARAILARCESEEAIALGHSLGIHLFQGRHIDATIAASRGPKTLTLRQIMAARG